jgi:hypothetical protein
LENWKHYLLGTPFTTVVLCDHKNLSYFRSAQKLNRRQARWGIFLSEFDLKLIHTPEAKIIQSDALSRRPDHITEDDENDDKILLPDDIFIKMIDLEMNEKLRRDTETDDFVQRAVESLKNSKIPPIKSSLEDWELRDDLLFYKGKCYVPPNEGTQKELT